MFAGADQQAARLNVALREPHGDVVTIFDAEDEPHPDIFNVVNTVMLREEPGRPVRRAADELRRSAGSRR